jgi:hypothetical protein
MLSFVMMRVARIPVADFTADTGFQLHEIADLEAAVKQQDQSRYEIAEDRLQAKTESDANGTGEHRKLGQGNSHQTGCDQYAGYDQGIFGEARHRVNRRP